MTIRRKIKQNEAKDLRDIMRHAQNINCDNYTCRNILLHVNEIFYCIYKLCE